MLGAIAGDIIGSVYEARGIKTKTFPLFDPRCTFTDDTVLTIAVAEAILTGQSYRACCRRMGRSYPNAGYGGSFFQWLRAEDPRPYNSWGNGAAMRVSPVGFAFATQEEVLDQAERTAEITHNHPEGIKGAKASALAVFLARTGHDKAAIKACLVDYFGYDLERSIDGIRPGYSFDISCQGTVPEAIIAFLDSSGYEDTVRNAVSLGGDSDTLACITGSIADAYYGGVPEEIADKVEELLTPDLWEVAKAFCEKFPRE
ncbi:MAG: ADP-ribosylglycohydrolase family protein [Desulfopila sp.]